jgi:hypothetical protein
MCIQADKVMELHREENKPKKAKKWASQSCGMTAWKLFNGSLL